MAMQKGLGAIRDAANNSTSMLKIMPNESAVVRILTPAEEIISIWEYTLEINGQWKTITALPRNEDPLQGSGNKPGFKSYLEVYDYTDKRVKILKASQTMGTQLLGLIEEYGDLTKRDFKIARQGEKLKTKYQFFARDLEPFTEKVERLNIEALIEDQTLTRDAILALMNTIGNVTDAPSGDVSNSGNQGGGSKNNDDFPF
ncbi:hypothetical protein P4V86_03315 [Brevibacillus laterosporus]|uniref:hypothetical protein n=1 Tax=Brevibacillus laterosporus TaxID=1465 RepID=UPI000379977C|nr:hypothetical protein [Brevibacillus laterosporus]ATO48552.1 hypothetical protein BrL25_05145 [Brevibacillus laterosporus DSM 25]MED2002387.1 hypothetical protein [Brevibacillus laterosporus]